MLIYQKRCASPAINGIHPLQGGTDRGWSCGHSWRIRSSLLLRVPHSCPRIIDRSKVRFLRERINRLQTVFFPHLHQLSYLIVCLPLILQLVLRGSTKHISCIARLSSVTIAINRMKRSHPWVTSDLLAIPNNFYYILYFINQILGYEWKYK